MQLIKQSHEIISLPDASLKTVEKVARTCYKSEDKICEGSDEKMIKMLIDKGHEAMIEFGDMTVKFITNRGVSHELVRHRLCSFAQESTRYVKYKEGITCIIPVWSGLPEREFKYKYQAHELPTDLIMFISACLDSELYYDSLLENKWRPEQAREVLPNALKTEINVKANFREWRNIFALRCQKAAHPQIVALMRPLLKEVSEKVPVIFDDLAKKFPVEGE